MVEKSSPVDGVRAINLKLEGSEGSSFAGPLANSLIVAVCQCFGTAEAVQQVLNKVQGYSHGRTLLVDGIENGTQIEMELISS